ncbi:hypothetical protein [Rhodobaculum claviforme]|uniref:Uncharacterized protein n=1 Tax=Rhodobaculum claviforme TaxID=1549854 RepID=A0A934TK28_9RHOB|nr:hypothetical protein [Rhodobaculum claviforme]MBK5926891.1 hypothetical protein [Rhodobaculum claviforme]
MPGWATAPEGCAWHWRAGGGIALWVERCALGTGVWDVAWNDAAGGFVQRRDGAVLGVVVQPVAVSASGPDPLAELGAWLVLHGHLDPAAACAFRPLTLRPMQPGMAAYALVPGRPAMTATPDASPGRDPGAGPDAGTEGGTEAGPDTGRASALNSGLHVALHVGLDTGLHIGADRGSDGIADPGADTGPDAAAETGANSGPETGPDADPDAVPDPPCGAWGMGTHGVRYALRHDAWPDRVVLVDEGQERPMFDPGSLRRLP